MLYLKMLSALFVMDKSNINSHHGARKPKMEANK
jgi:hypothetical protein